MRVIDGPIDEATKRFRCPDAPAGHNHFEFLDKGLNGATWKTVNYDPRVSNVDDGIVGTLGGSDPSVLDFGGCPQRPAEAYVDGRPPQADSCDVHIGSRGCPFVTVSDANAAANNGTTIMIAPGNYAGNATFTKQLTLRSRCGSVRIGG